MSRLEGQKSGDLSPGSNSTTGELWENDLTHWCRVCQGMIMRNSEIMSGKPFELLHGKRLHKHKLLLLLSPP